jgi:hypothetical protein
VRPVAQKNDAGQGGIVLLRACKALGKPSDSPSHGVEDFCSSLVRKCRVANDFGEVAEVDRLADVYISLASRARIPVGRRPAAFGRA